MLEIEIKAYADDAERVRDAAEAMGALFRYQESEEDAYYNHPCRDFAITDEALRIRKTGQRAFITYKGPKIGAAAKTREEIELPTEDPQLLEKILTRLGFTFVARVCKTRAVYAIGEIEICMDQVDGVGAFVELEKMSDDRESGERELFALAARLGLDRFERRSYLELLLEKKA